MKMSLRSPGDKSSETVGSPALRRSSRETLGKKSGTPVKSSVNQSPPVVRKSERLKKNSPESSPSKCKTQRVESHSSPSPSPLRRSERGKSQSSPNSTEIKGKSTGMPDAEVVKEKLDEYVGAKRRRLDAKHFKELFFQQKNGSVSPESNKKPKRSGKAPAPDGKCLSVEREAEDKHQHEDKLNKAVPDENQEVITSDKGFECADHLSQSSYPSNKTVFAEDGHVSSNMHNVALESGNMPEPEDSEKMRDTQKSLHLVLNTELQKLCELLNLSEDVKKMAERFLEYVMENHHVTKEPVTLLHAFQLSVCWIAVSLRKQKINCQESFALAKKHLDFCCSEEDADYVYLKMGLLKELFIQSAVIDKTNVNLHNSVIPVKDSSEDTLVGLIPGSSETMCTKVYDTEKLLVKIIRHLKRKIRERMTILIEKQHQEIEKLQKSSDEEMTQLDQQYKVEVVVVHSIHAHNPSVAAERLKALEDLYSKKLEDHKNNLNMKLKILEEKHSSERDRENKLTFRWKEDIVKEQVDLLRKLPYSDSEVDTRKINSNETIDILDGHKDRMSENQDVVSQPCISAGEIEVRQLVIHDKTSDLPPITSELGNNSNVVDAVISTSSKVLLEDSASIEVERDLMQCGQAANCVDLTPDMDVPEYTSVGVLPLCLSAPAPTDEPNTGKLNSIASQRLSTSAAWISGSELSNPITIDVPLSHSTSSDTEVSARHDSEAPPADSVVPLPPSLAAPDKEADKSSLVPSSQPDNVLPTCLHNVEESATEGQAELPSSTITLRSEQSDSHNQNDEAVDHSATDHSNDEHSAAEAVHKLQATGLELPPSTVTPRSEQSDPYMQLVQPLLHNATDHTNIEPSDFEAVQQSTATEGQPGLSTPTITARHEPSDSGIQLDQPAVNTTTDHSNVEPSATEAVDHLPATEGQPELWLSTITPGSEQSHSDMQLDQQLLRTVLDHSDVEPSAVGAVHQLPSTEEQTNLPSRLEQPESDIQLDQSLLRSATDHSYVNPSAPEAMDQLPQVNLSSSQGNSSLPLSEEQPSRGTGSTPITDAPTPSPSPSAATISSVTPTNVAINQTTSPGSRARHSMSDFATTLLPGAPTVSLRMPISSYFDPLQKEIERIQNEADRSIKIFEEMKQQLNSECEKEIEEIRKKYETKSVELAAEFKCKKDELEAFHNKVYMNKMLAEALRSKCMETKVFVPPGMVQDNVQHQLFRSYLATHSVWPTERPTAPSASSTEPTARNLHAPNSVMPPGSFAVPRPYSVAPTARNLPATESLASSGCPTVHSTSSAVPTTRNLLSYQNCNPASQNTLPPDGPPAAAAQNSLRPVGAPASASQNSLGSGSPAAAPSQNSLRPGGPLASGSQQTSHNPLCGPSSATLPPRSTPVQRSTGTSPVVQATMSPTGTSPAAQGTVPRPVPVVNRLSASLSGNSLRPVSTTSATPPAVNLHSVSGIRAPPPHLRSRVSQLAAAITTDTGRHLSPSAHPQYSNVALSAPSSTSQHNSYHRPLIPQSVNAAMAIPELTEGTVSALRLLSDIHTRLQNGMAVNATHPRTAMPINVHPQTSRSPSPPIQKATVASGSASTAAQDVVCLSDDE